MEVNILQSDMIEEIQNSVCDFIVDRFKEKIIKVRIFITAQYQNNRIII